MLGWHSRAGTFGLLVRCGLNVIQVLGMVDELHPQHQQHTLAGVLLVEDDSSCLLVRDGVEDG